MELLSPAGNFQSIVAAAEAGADSIYIGLKEFSARAFAANFSIEQIPSIYSYLKSKNIKLYIAINTILKENDIKNVIKYLEVLTKTGIDAVIVQDFGIVNIVNHYFPSLKLHASTQMTNLNYFDVKFLEKLNFKRVILDRQLFIDEIKDIKEKTSIEIEIFIHGALCYSFAGQCYFSSFLGGQSANRGRCTQPCRRSYILNNQKKGYFFSPCDLSSVNNFEKILNLNLTSLKIEGRMKSEQYVENVTKAYRILIDFYNKNGYINKEVKEKAKELIRNSFGRKTTDGIYFNSKSIIEPNLSGGTGIFLGKTIRSSIGSLIFKTNVSLSSGDRIRVQDIGESFKVNNIIIKNKIQKFAQKGEIVKIILSKKTKFNKNQLIFKISAGKNYQLPDIFKKRKKLRINEVPLLELVDKGNKKKELYFKLKNLKDILSFPDNFRDFLIVPAIQTAEIYKIKKKLNQLKENIIFELPFFILENDINKFAKISEELTKIGFKKFLVHSKSQLEFFNNDNSIFLILSERFHIANSFAADFFLKFKNIKRFIIDLENDKENYNEFKLKNNAIVTLFSHFPLLISRIDNKLKSGSELIDKKNIKFFIKKQRCLINIFSHEAYNILSHRNELEKIGYSKFFFDMSNLKFNKLNIKNLYNKLKAGKIASGKDFNYTHGWN